MFGLNLPALASVRPKVDPKDVPPPTPIVFPAPHTPTEPASPAATLVSTLQSACRPTDIQPSLFDALGLRTHYDAEPSALLPDPSFLPDFASWRQLSPDEAREKNQSTRRTISNGNLSPGCQTYAERCVELSTPNEDAFRTVRRLPATKGKKQPRLGNSYEFFRCLELMTPYWDDTAAAPRKPPSPKADTDTNDAAETPVDDNDDDAYYRTMAGTAMPAEHRHGLLSAFIKLVAYDFGCNVTTPRAEPRLNLCSQPPSPHVAPRKSYVPSGCIFVFRTPTTREQARAGIVEGPVAAVSARATISLDAPLERDQDLAREALAALVTAQHRAREGKTEVRFGEGQWWTTKPRWGGGTGGPIGREVEGDEVVGDKDSGAPPPKKPRKTIAAYDNYRMVRPPSSSWDRKAKYVAVGRIPGAEFDDVFVISSLFHHVSLLRVRVPMRLLGALEGEVQEETPGELEMWRSRWYDFFVTEERIEAMELLWGLFAYQMRAKEQES